MDSPTPPTPPDPRVTADAQAKMNKETAVAQYGLAATNQDTPQGRLEYDQIGTWPDGTPRYESTQTLSPGEQSVYDLGLNTRQNAGRIGVEQSSRIRELLGKPFQIGDIPSAEDNIVSIQRERLDPLWDQRSRSLENNLINRGIRPGSVAYDRAHDGFGESRNDDYRQMFVGARNTALGERQQAIQERLSERNQPLNELASLLSASPVGQPQFRGTPTPGVAPTDYIGAVGQNMAQQNANYQAQVAQNNAMMGGLFGLGKTMMGLPFGGWGKGFGFG